MERTRDQLSLDMHVIGIDHYPFTKEELTKLFKEKIHIYHPDKYKGEDAHEKTVQILSSYKKLKSYASDYSLEDKEEEIEEEKDLFKFTQPCTHCEGKGNNTVRQRVEPYNCPKCKDTDFINVKCNKCDHGKFTLKNGKVVDCLACKGTGIYKLKCNHNISIEDMLYGRYDHLYHYKDVVVKCKMCRGSGKIPFEPINPVIPKGAVL